MLFSIDQCFKVAHQQLHFGCVCVYVCRRVRVFSRYMPYLGIVSSFVGRFEALSSGGPGSRRGGACLLLRASHSPSPDLNQEAEKALHYLETIGPAPLVGQLLVSLACTAGFLLSEAQTVSNINALRRFLQYCPPFFPDRIGLSVSVGAVRGVSIVN